MRNFKSCHGVTITVATTSSSSVGTWTARVLLKSVFDEDPHSRQEFTNMLVAPTSSLASSSSSPTSPADIQINPDNSIDIPPTLHPPSGYRRSYLQFSDLRTKRRRTSDTLTSSLSKVGTMRLESYLSDHQTLSLHPALCSNCVPVCQDEGYASSTPKPDFPVVEECTEECVVVPCGKEALCFDDNCLEETCDIQPCDGGADCMAFEDFVSLEHWDDLLHLADDFLAPMLHR